MKNSPKWKPYLLISGNGSILICLLSLLVPPFNSLWKKIDLLAVDLAHIPLHLHPMLHKFWALANQSIADWFADAVFLSLIIAALIQTQKKERLTRLAELLFCILLTALTIICINRLFCRNLLSLQRESPSRVFSTIIDFQDLPKWLHYKTHSTKSFPGDHATTALLFTSSYAFFVRGKLGLLALLYGVFLCIPRLIIGAHWLSDIAVGTISIVLFSLTWAFGTPMATWTIQALKQTLEKILAKWQDEDKDSKPENGRIGKEDV